LIDFGIAGTWKTFNGDSSKAGTIRYCPPEIVFGENYESDPRIDSWGLGVLFYKMVYGAYPFPGRT
jgi:serine/threonine protein kinase